MKQIERISRLHKLVELAGGEICTRKKFHKLVYLLQIAGEDLDQDFIFHNFGVFSVSLANDLDVATSDDLKVLNETDGGENGYVIRAATADVDANCLCNAQFSARSRKLIPELARRSPRLLETLSTIVYLSHNYYSGPELKAKLRSLKPKLTGFYAEAFELAEKHFGIRV